ncbi:hypothetical protein LQZ19_00395 [Treponema primitia]|uniref:hypothetical protein n=1 Tax=Treponema primitia TaxID=88058 RepID=UPI0039805BDF
MKRVLEEKKLGHLQEMSYPCKKSDGYGLIIEIRSTDEHGELGNKELPAHAHIYDTNKNPVGEIEITVQKPEHSNDVIPYRSELPDGYSNRIYKWANDSNKLGLNHWDCLIEAWNRRMPD